LHRVLLAVVLLVAAGLALKAVTNRATTIQPQAQRSSQQAPVHQVEITPVDPTFVGREVCRECHAENFHLHGQHGHHATFTSASDPEIIKMFAGKSFDAGEPYGTYTYHADEHGLFARLPEKFGDQPFRLEYALGSPHSAVTLLSLIPDGDQGTAAIEHRASWFTKANQLGPSPGQEAHAPETPAELFGRKHTGTVMHRCVYCHTTSAKIENQQIADLIPNVNCEKCHGPASVHVHQARTMTNPPKFSVGRSDWDAESEIQLCGDCHRLPGSISRKMLRDYPIGLTRFQPVGLLRSKCFVESEGKLKCSTCHNPHQTIKAVSQEEHLQKCINCHLDDSPTQVACSVSPKQGCIECHMPAQQIDVLGSSFHDHWIRVREAE
jgi:Cytochrome c554 and c-prime